MWPFNLSYSVKVLMQWGHWSSFLFSLFCWPFVVCHIWIHSQNCGVRICDSRFWVKFHFCARLIFGPPHPQSFWVELLELCDSQTKNWTRYLKSFPLFVGCLKLMKLSLTISGRSTKKSPYWVKQMVAKSSHKLSPKLVIIPSPKLSPIPADPQKNHPMGWNKKWQNCHMNFHQIRWSYYHLNITLICAA